MFSGAGGGFDMERTLVRAARVGMVWKRSKVGGWLLEDQDGCTKRLGRDRVDAGVTKMSKDELVEKLNTGRGGGRFSRRRGVAPTFGGGEILQVE